MLRCRSNSLLSRVLVLMLPCSLAWGVTTNLHEFKVVRDGATYFLDSFSDGFEPPQSPAQTPAFGCGTTCYFIGGTFPDGAETGDRLGLDSSLGASSSNAVGTAVLTQRATLSLSTTPTVNAGLQAHRVFEVSGLFDFVIPEPGGSYYIVLNDRTAGNTMNDFVQVQVSSPLGAGSPVIRFRKQDFVTDSIVLFDADPVSAADGDQVRLILSHPTADTNTIFGAYEFFKAGASQGVVSLDGSASIYTGEIWTRPEFATAQVVPIPEPHTYLLLAAGLALVGGVAARKRRTAG